MHGTESENGTESEKKYRKMTTLIYIFSKIT